MSDETEALLDQEDMSERQEFQDETYESQEQDLQESYNETGNVPYQRRPDSLFSLFQKVWKSEDSSKVANLDKFELGKPDITVRDAQYLDLLGVTLKHQQFAKFFRKKGEITLATSASKKGWFTELFVSQKKFTTRTSASVNNEPQAQKKKWRIFSQENTEPEKE